MPIPSPPKRDPNFGQKKTVVGIESEYGTEVDVDASMDSSSVRDFDDAGIFAPASPQTVPVMPASVKPKKGKKKKKGQLIEPLPVM